MTPEEKISYIEQHLQHELRFLMSSVEIWKISKEKDFGFIVNMFRDSACVHFRTLIKFFTAKGKYDVSITDFGIDTLLKSDYKNWINVIDEAILHISPKRNKTSSVEEEEDLNDQIENFKTEILRLWKEFEKKAPNEYKPILIEVLARSNREVSDDINGLNKKLI